MTEEDSIHRVFVYGTLRPKDESYNYLPATHVLWGYAMYNYYHRFPYIEKAGTPDYVVGNIIEVDDDGLANLDVYEGVHNNLYSRIKVTVESLDEDVSQKDEEVWVYVADEISLKVKQGDWANV